MAQAVLKSWQRLLEAYSEREIVRLIESGAVQAVVDLILQPSPVALSPVRDQIRRTVTEGVKFATRTLPTQTASQLTISFDILNPDVIRAVRTLETKVMQGMTDSVRETVRQGIEAGLAKGEGSKSIARNLRDVLSLAPQQEQAVRNYEAMLRSGDNGVLSRSLRDKRFDGTLKKLLSKGLSEEQIQKMTAAYRKKMVAHNAETISRTAVADAMKLGQILSIQHAIDMGVYDPSRLKRQWIGVNDDREREEHVAMNDQIVPWNEPYSTGQTFAGQGDWNCRCIDRFFQSR